MRMARNRSGDIESWLADCRPDEVKDEKEKDHDCLIDTGRSLCPLSKGTRPSMTYIQFCH